MHSLESMGNLVVDPWKRVRERAIANGDEDLRALLRDADEMRRFILHVKRASTWSEWPLHGDAKEVLDKLGRPLNPARIASERREPMRLEEDQQLH